MSIYSLMITLCLIILASFLFSQIQHKYKISSVILLILSGMLLQVAVHYTGIQLALSAKALQLFGTLGLLVIVLEAVMDMQIHRGNAQTFSRAFLAASLVIGLTAGGITAILSVIYHLAWGSALIYALPLAIVSSAIVVPSISTLASPATREFLILESIFSDIVGVLLFNFLASAELDHLASWGSFSFSLVLMIIISIVTTYLLGMALSRANGKHIHVVILAVLVLIYAIAKSYHLSALLLIVVFGLSLKNLPGLFASKFAPAIAKRHFKLAVIQANLSIMHEFVGDVSFIIRSIFFVLLGLSINFSQLVSLQVVLVGSLLLGLIYLLRGLSLRGFLPANAERSLATYMAPRGLITVLLFFQIPPRFAVTAFPSGIIFFVVIVSSLVMSFGLIDYFRRSKGRSKLST